MNWTRNRGFSSPNGFNDSNSRTAGCPRNHTAIDRTAAPTDNNSVATT